MIFFAYKTVNFLNNNRKTQDISFLNVFCFNEKDEKTIIMGNFKV